jgi:hypothetical protein
MRAYNPAAAAHLYGMDRLAGQGAEGLPQQHLRQAEQHLVKLRLQNGRRRFAKSRQHLSSFTHSENLVLPLELFR